LQIIKVFTDYGNKSVYELACSSTQKESVEIHLADHGYRGIPCVKAVDYKDVVADIDVVPNYDESDDNGMKDWFRDMSHSMNSTLLLPKIMTLIILGIYGSEHRK
jgi:hypothetical protein